jgi:PAS domain S-box-containing protein
MKDSQQKFEALFQHASMGILVANARGEIVLANNFLLEQFGYSSTEELIGNKVEQLIPRRYHTHHEKHRTGYIKNPQARPMGVGLDLFAVRKDGSEFPVEISLSNYTTDEGIFAIAFISDITRRKEIETAMMEQKAELSKEKELSDLKSRFVSMASHEFRTPLSTILSSASLLAKYTETVDQEKRDKHIHRIKSSVNNLTDILNEFLSIGKIEDGKVAAHYADINIREMFTAISTEMQAIAKEGQQIVYDHKGNETVHLDPVLLRNIIINLLSNAIKFSPERSTILFTSIVDPSQIILSVKDNGIGITAEDQEHLFERFFRGVNVTNIQGTGLGLHIVGKYIELMNGQIEFKSELEKGTEFIIKFSVP